MRKYLFFIGLLLLPLTVNAADANIDLTVSQDKVSVGKTVIVTADVNSNTPIGYYEYTLDYDHDKLELIKGRSYNIENADNSTTKSFKKQFTFKVKNVSANKVSVKSYAVSSTKNESMSVTINPAYINSSGNNTISDNDNNNLSKLEIENYKLEPTFNKNTTNYILKIEDDINEINIIAKAENSKAEVSGNGKRSLKNGDNRIEVTVTSVSGKDKTYTIKVRLVSQNNIQIKIDDKTYTVLKKISDFNSLKGYKVKTIKLKDATVEALYNSKTDITLVGLKDDNGKTALYIYNIDDDSYTSYNKISSDSISILPVNSSMKFKNFTTYNETIGNNEVTCYKASSDSNYCILYAMDLTSGEKDWYVYDIKEKTIQKYNNDIDTYYEDRIDNTKVLIYILSGTTLLFGIMTIVFAINSGKRK